MPLEEVNALCPITKTPWPMPGSLSNTHCELPRLPGLLCTKILTDLEGEHLGRQACLSGRESKGLGDANGKYHPIHKRRGRSRCAQEWLEPRRDVTVQVAEAGTEPGPS